ncbi:unnamed protein product, partial [Brassica rapa]
MQPACAQVSAKSILTGALKSKRVNSSLHVHSKGPHDHWAELIHPFSTLAVQYAWPRSYHNKNKGKMLTLGWM